LEIQDGLLGQEHKETAISKLPVCCVGCDVACLVHNRVLGHFVSRAKLELDRHVLAHLRDRTFDSGT
jgi:hypothetical protein